MHNKFIPYGRQSVDDEDIEAVVKVLHSDWLTTGPAVDRLEKALAERAGSKYCAVLNSGTAALHAAYFAAGVGPGDEVITTPITFAATANATLYLGAKPIFADITENGFHMDPGEIEPLITKKTRVIAPVDMAGMVSDLDNIMRLADRYNLTVVEDASHALGASYRGQPVGSIADMTVFSFHPVKHITTGEGGAVTTDSEKYYHHLQIFKNHGIVRDPAMFTAAADRGDNPGRWYYEQQFLGYNYRLPDINCALGLRQLEKLDSYLARRSEIVDSYNKAFQRNPRLLTPPPVEEGCGLPPDSTAPAWHLYILRLAGDNPPRRQVVDSLFDYGIGTQVHYIPVYMHPYYQKLGYNSGLCPQAEDYYKRAFSIPLFPAMSDEDVEKVIDRVNHVCAP